MDLVEEEAQIEASAAFSALRRRMKQGAGEAPRLRGAAARRLRPYQKAGVRWLARLAHWGAGALPRRRHGPRQDRAGAGAARPPRGRAGPALVVAPTSVVANWAARGARASRPRCGCALYRGADRAARLRGPGPGRVCSSTSYAHRRAATPRPWRRSRFATLVLDEAQAVKNAATERARARPRAASAGWRLALTGTPIENHLGELWSLLRA